MTKFYNLGVSMLTLTSSLTTKLWSAKLHLVARKVNCIQLNQITTSESVKSI